MIEELENKLIKYTSELNLNINDLSILSTISGGVDSVLLSSLLINLSLKHRFNISLIHFNHKMHDLSSDVELLCRSFSIKNNIEIYIYDICAPKYSNFESYSRYSRYRTLNKLSQKLNFHIVITAHHYDDQIETLYMKYLDNADWISKIGIREYYGRLRRPFLDIRKEEIIRYANEINLKWIEDPSNENLNIRRNKIRKNILPEIKNDDSDIEIELLSQSKIYLVKMNKYFNEFNSKSSKIILKKTENYISIELKEISSYNIEKLKLFIYWFYSNYLNIKSPQFKRGFWLNFQRFLNGSRSGAIYNIGKATFIINRNELHISIKYMKLLKTPAKIQLFNECKWYDSLLKIHVKSAPALSNDKYTCFIPKDNINEGIFVRRWKFGDRICSTGSKKNILLSNIFVNNKISIIGKLLHPIIVDKSDNVIWIPGLMHSDLFNRSQQVKNKKVEWVQAL